MISYLLIALGGAAGSVFRFWLSNVVAGTRPGEIFPLGTLIVNLSGSFLIGFLGAMGVPEGRVYLHPMARQFLMIGLCGGYTTFSSFSLQTMNLAQDGEWLYAGLNVILSVALCLVAVWLGYLTAQAFTK
jgi:CrcB protein